LTPSGKFFYFTITISAAFRTKRSCIGCASAITRRPRTLGSSIASRSPDRFRPRRRGFAFAKSGNLYVGLIGTNEIAVLNPAGEEIRRISSPLLESPWGFAFLGESLLVTNADVQPVEHPDSWKVLKYSSVNVAWRSIGQVHVGIERTTEKRERQLRTSSPGAARASHLTPLAPLSSRGEGEGSQGYEPSRAAG